MPKNQLLLNHLDSNKKKIELRQMLLFSHVKFKTEDFKKGSNYQEEQIERKEIQDQSSSCCIKCKFNLGDEKKCYIVEGEINDYGISKFFSPKDDGMLPGDIVWDFIKKTGRKLDYNEGYVIDEGAKEYQCKDCKYYMYYGNCLLIKGDFTPEMSCGFIVKIGNGTEV